MSIGRGRGGVWNHNQEPWHPGQGPNFHPYYGNQFRYNPRPNFRGGYGYSQPPPALAFNPRLPPPSHQHHLRHHRQDNGYNYRRGGGFNKDHNQRQQQRPRPSTPSIENLTSIKSTEQSSDTDRSDGNKACSGLASQSCTSETSDEKLNDVSSSQLKNDKIVRMENPQLKLISPLEEQEPNPKDGNNNKNSEGMDENQEGHIMPGYPIELVSQTERIRTSIETKTLVQSSDISCPQPSNSSNNVSNIPNTDHCDNDQEETVLRQKVKMDKVYVWDFAMTSNDLANVGWGKSPRTPRAVQVQTEKEDMGGNCDSGTSVKEEFPEDDSNCETDGIDCENVEIDCDPESVWNDYNDESSETRTSEIPKKPLPPRLNVNSPEPQVHSTSSFETPESNIFQGVGQKDPDATVPFGLGIEEMHLTSLLGQSGSEKGVVIQGKKKTAAQKIKELKELGRKRASKTIEIEKINKDIGFLLKLHRKKTAEMKALQREEKTVMNA